MNDHQDNHDEYLWDQSGEPDPLISKLESTLAPARFDPQPTDTIVASRTSSSWWARPRNLVALALAASVVFLATLVVMGPMNRRNAPGWAVTRVTGTLSLGDRLPVSEWLETDAESSVRLAVADLGYVEVQPESRMRIRKVSSREQRMELASGKIDAVITAPPRLFLVDTPAALAVDLGCAYTLEVDDEGNGELIVRAGWVNLETEDGRVSTVPSGGHCRMAAGRGPGTPYFPDAVDRFLTAVDAFDAGDDATSVDALLAHARAKDTLTLWHVFQRVEDAERKRVLDRVQSIVPDSLRSIDTTRLTALDHDELETWRVQLRPSWR